MLLSRLIHLLQVSVNLKSLPLTQQAHALSLTLGLFNEDPIIASKLISSYSHLSLPSLSRQIFESFALNSPPNVLLWNSLLSSYCNNRIFSKPISLFARMRARLRPDNYTLAIVSKASAELEDFRAGRLVHCLVVKLGFYQDTVLSNSIMRFYSRCENFGDARKLFDEMPMRSVASWNSIISQYADLESGEEEVWSLFEEMQAEGIKPDAFTISTVLPWCWSSIRGREIHCYLIRMNLGLNSDFHMGSCLINMYSKGNRVDVGRRVFDRMIVKNVVVWTTMINGYVENAEFEEGLDLFRMMQFEDGILPNKVSLVTVLPAIGSLARFIDGKQVHAFAIRKELNREPSLNNALIDMYSKCGTLDSAKCIFDDQSWCKDAISWSTIISCYGIHGKGEEAVILFNRMCNLGTKPDHITSVGVLSACGRSGLVSEGLEIYNSLVKDYGVVPTVEICSCMVDMLGRAGRLSKALDFIKSMPHISGSSVWGALFDSSFMHNNREMHDLAFRTLLHLEPESPSNFITRSNFHASSERWDVVAEVRKTMKERGLKKMPGWSSITINRTVHSFFAADTSHHYPDTIYAMLDNLLLTMKGAGYVPTYEKVTEPFTLGSYQ
ncbi:uncharacterized protein A4U43_C04F2720 [Asparagus officinalis]|uniref:Pentatricopeptide repeat-containing protein n=1 Tax=Asparagus officinalis TaxID=4686 RepID=A0A5P1EYG0_ASPOF|nr:pentatricopeptide repeat-containing protein At3g57430, chloroplastic-like [Asparagus officinalis]XP_020259950.1 pentatricopeptide repeat-containing protein At3g57430, chloroplastic-like [Asparagus officinalis]XP_020259951.1 pentatricopeptide repeat-containing protein At3g57430, chloroplastic-like [Asparagus officinalis]XP_020259952.1 pentatricopeptide repeat-containing protein At3g57430, chloroplastic-like [Asparagus officinalis]ONK70904.1 uncharacterized protein A4U43_C04F2720 [Asparagus of